MHAELKAGRCRSAQLLRLYCMHRRFFGAMHATLLLRSYHARQKKTRQIDN